MNDKPSSIFEKKTVNNCKKTVQFVGILESAINNYNQGIKTNYDKLLEELSNPFIKSSHLLECYRDGRMYAHMLDQSHSEMVNVFLKVKWMERESEVIAEFCSFVVALVTTNPVHLRHVLKSMIGCFVPGVTSVEKGGSSLFNDAVYKSIHHVLKTIFTLIPQSSLVVEKVFAESFPYMRKPDLSLEWYVKNLLYATTYRPALRPCILRIIVKNLIELDVHSPRTDIEREEENAEDENMFEMDEDTQLNNVQGVTMKHELANKLDLLMNILLQYIHDVCYKEGNLHLDESRKLFREVVAVFDDIILPIHQLNHVQFIIFYMCSFKQSFVESFIEHCWKKVLDVNFPMVMRQASASYIASLLARAKYVSLSMAKDTLDVMISWSHRYLKTITEASSLDSYYCDVTKHGTFYSVCQAIFYVVIFRHVEILESSLGHKYIQSLNLQHLIVSHLNPLKVCLSSVVILFASAMRTHQLVYCDTIIERNNRQMLPVVGSASVTETSNPLESFFPFDPCLLRRCLTFISSFYVEWKGDVPVESSDEESEDDEFLDVVDASSAPHNKYSLSISPGFSLASHHPF